MPRKDFFHQVVRQALEKDGWIITADPLDLTIGEVELFADLGADRVIAADRGTDKIAIEIKSFMGESPVSEFHKALGQYANYRLSLSEIEPARTVWLAVPVGVWNSFFQRPFIQKSIDFYRVELIIFDPDKIEILKWIK
jgi:hypothetical protein